MKELIKKSFENIINQIMQNSTNTQKKIISATIKTVQTKLLPLLAAKWFKVKHCFYTDEKIFELFCIENSFARYFTKYLYLLKYFVSLITVVLRNDTFILQDKSKMAKGELYVIN